MKTSNPLLLAEVDILEGVLRVDANDLVVVMEIEKLTEENARLRDDLRQRVEFAYIEGFSDGRNDSELMQKNNAADEFKRSRAFESLEKLLKGDEDE